MELMSQQNFYRIIIEKMARAINLSWIRSKENINLVALNIPELPQLYKLFYAQAGKILVADGAANTIKHLMETSTENLAPQLVIGDFDSISSDTQSFFPAETLKKIEDQDSTDLDKCLQHVESGTTVVLGNLAGRFDHSFGILNSLKKYSRDDSQIFLYDGKNVLFLVQPGESYINLHEDWNYCGLIPIDGPTRVSSEGLHWNLHNTVLSFGGLVSSSNYPESGSVKVVTDKPLIFTCSKRS